MSGPDVWGPHGWKFIHYITLGYPNNPTKEIKEKYFNFFQSLQHVIPCSICGAHFQEHMKRTPLTDEILSNKLEFIHWGIHMHNLVNEINGKKVFKLKDGVKEIKKQSKPYDCKIPYDFNTKEEFSNSNKNDNMYLIIILCLVSVIIFLGYKQYKK